MTGIKDAPEVQWITSQFIKCCLNWIYTTAVFLRYVPYKQAQNNVQSQGFFYLMFLKDLRFPRKSLQNLSPARVPLHQCTCSLSVCRLVQTQMDGQVLKGFGRGTVKDRHVSKTTPIRKYIFIGRRFFSHSKHFKLTKKGIKFTVPTLLSLCLRLSSIPVSEWHFLQLSDKGSNLGVCQLQGMWSSIFLYDCTHTTAGWSMRWNLIKTFYIKRDNTKDFQIPKAVEGAFMGT